MVVLTIPLGVFAASNLKLSPKTHKMVCQVVGFKVIAIWS